MSTDPWPSAGTQEFIERIQQENTDRSTRNLIEGQSRRAAQHGHEVAFTFSQDSELPDMSLYGIRPHRQMTQSEYDENKRAIEAWLNTPQAKALLAKNILEISLEQCPNGVEPKLQPQELNTGLVREEPAG